MKHTDQLKVVRFLNSTAMQEALRLFRLHLQLLADVCALEKPAKKEKAADSFYRRQYVRAAAALVEGTISMMKQQAMSHPKAFSPEEMLLLQEKEVYLQDNGISGTRQRFLRFDANIRFAFAAYAKAHNVVFTLDCGTTGWENLKKLFRIRDRITHPKNEAELPITDDELRCIQGALDFVSDRHDSVGYTIQKEQWIRDGLPEDSFAIHNALQKRLVQSTNRKLSKFKSDKELLTELVSHAIKLSSRRKE